MRHVAPRPALLAIALAALLPCAAGCGGSQPPPKSAEKDEGVPANSLSDARLHGEEDPNDVDARRGSSPADPTEPYTTKVGDAPPAETGGDSGGGTGGKAGSKPAAGAKDNAGGKGVVSRAECDRVMDRYLELEIDKNPQLKDVPPEIIEQAKQMAREKHGDAPCTATRAQYTCAMSAGSTAAWQRCMK